MAPSTLASRLVRLEQTVAQRDNTSLNPQASLAGLDPLWVADEIAHCRADAVYFVDCYCRVQSDEGKGLVPFRLYDYQKEVLRAFEEHREVIVLKARQLGISELAAAYAVWIATFRPLNTIIVLSQGEAEAKEFTSKARLCWSHLPEWLRVPDRDPAKTSSLELVNGSRILPKPATGKAGRSLTAQLLILDEWAHQEAQREIFTAASPVARSAGNKIIGISTANGAGNHFHEQWLLAQEGLGMFPLFMPWDVDYDAVGNPSARVGWPTTSKTKPIMIDALATTFRERRPWRNAALIGEARTYVVKDNGDTGASGNLHDDWVTAYAIGEMVRRHEPMRVEVTTMHDELAAIMDDAEWERLMTPYRIETRY